MGRRPREGDRRAILKKFPLSRNMPIELAGYGRGSYFTRETRKEKRSNLFDIVEDEDTFDATAMSLLPPTECNHIKDDTNQKNSNTGEEDAESSIGSTTGTEYYSCIAELDNNNNGFNEAYQRTNDYYRRVTLKWIFVISNFVCEILTALFEQLSSPHQSHYALIGMTMSLAATIICVIEIVYKCRQQKVTWRIRGKIYWFYHPPPSHKCFGTFKDIFGFACAALQSISGVISYTFYLKHGNSPVKISLCSVVFALGLLCSKFCDEQEKVDID
ncbi:uncharacterized protein LOC116126559 [Pistacia vera]|uniref:uncharacterized protein LOC116126559 n=1 Tax=Pistacia vera TaxID=55513 RepID=UPI001263ACBE|nr:uncharacterized protein LOC116126559 [Pistacia vera]